jgi:tetratricopeptide (TPR) repeat protein
VRISRARLLQNKGDAEDAESQLRAILERLDDLPTDPSITPSIVETSGWALLTLGLLEVEADTRDVRVAGENTLEEAARRLDDIVDKNPERASARDLAAKIHRALAKSHLNRAVFPEDLEPAVPAIEKSLALLDSILPLDPTNVAWRHGRFQSLRLLGHALLRQGFDSQAVAAFEKARDIVEGLVGDCPNHEIWHFDRAMAWYDLAGAQFQMGDVSPAQESAGTATEWFEAASPGDRVSPEQWMLARVRARERQGDIAVSSRQTNGANVSALEFFNDALLCLDAPDSHDHLELKGWLLVKMGREQAAAGYNKNGRASLEQAQEIFLELRGKNRYQYGLAWVLYHLSEVPDFQ